MSFRDWLIQWSAADDQRLQVFRRFYQAAGIRERERFREYIRAIAALSPSGIDDEVRFAGEIGCSSDRIVEVQVSCSLLSEEQSATVDPHLLILAIESWDRGEEFAPPGLG